MVPLTAALSCAALFGTWHRQYSEINYVLMVSYCLVHALVYERIRTLLPLMIAHAILNAAVSAIQLAAFR